MKQLALLLVALATGCALETAETETDIDIEEALDAPEAETQLDLLTLSGSCYWGSGLYWCHDYYTKKWCTGAHPAHGWDWTACTWQGWDGDKYCAGGWQWSQTHNHCD